MMVPKVRVRGTNFNICVTLNETGKSSDNMSLRHLEVGHPHWRVSLLEGPELIIRNESVMIVGYYLK